MKKPQVEVLAPASGLETIQAAVYAGADAVYTGGSKFGARAYADNLIEQQLLEAIDFVHLHGKKLYLTVNTLLKERELEQELIPYIEPFYRQGLDAVIVQDLGVFLCIRKHFKDLAVHVSTQAVVTGADSAKLYEELGAERIVTARELSLPEIRAIREQTSIEIESFVHGALCYCYSGQCLFSSFIGPRSGNRGRCAQPCRLPYTRINADGKKEGRRQESYLLSPKDMCALDILPDIIEAGVYSLKIEGRMKRLEYAAGVTQMYRKYVDLYLEKGRAGYQVEAGDRNRLMDLYNRGSFHTGYYQMHNGPEMMSMERPNHNGVYAGTLHAGKKGYQMKTVVALHKNDMLEFRSVIDKKTGKPLELMAGMDVKKNSTYFLSEKYGFLLKNKTEVEVYRTRNAKLLEELHDAYGTTAKQIPIQGYCEIVQGRPVSLEVRHANQSLKITGEVVQEALKQPADEAYVRKQLEKTGNALFCWESLEVHIEGACFVNVKSLNQLRRDAFGQLADRLVTSYRRTVTEVKDDAEPQRMNGEMSQKPQSGVMVESLAQFDKILHYPQIDAVDVSIHAFTCLMNETEAVSALKSTIEMAHAHGKQIYLVMPYILRENKKELVKRLLTGIDGIDGFVAKNMESFAFLKSLEKGKHLPIRLDYMAYATNREAVMLWKELGADSVTLPVEWTRSELLELVKTIELPYELVLYGHMPMMVSAQCVVKNTTGCRKQMQQIRLQDRKKQLHYVKNYCDFCYNVIYNSEPFSLLDLLKETKELKPQKYKLHFTVESPQEVAQIMDVYVDALENGQSEPLSTYTRGHWKRGVD